MGDRALELRWCQAHRFRDGEHQRSRVDKSVYTSPAACYHVLKFSVYYDYIRHYLSEQEDQHYEQNRIGERGP